MADSITERVGVIRLSPQNSPTPQPDIDDTASPSIQERHRLIEPQISSGAVSLPKPERQHQSSLSSETKHEADHQESTHVPYWKPWQLHNTWLIAATLVVEVGIIATIIILDRLSARNQGFIAVGSAQIIDQSKGIIHIVLPISFLWRGLPVFLMQCFSALWNTIVDRASKLQPYVELSQNPKPFKTTLLLDYAEDIIFCRPYKAFRKGHARLAFAFLSVIIFMIVTTLTSYLFFEAQILIAQTVRVIPNAEFNTDVNPNSFDVTGAINYVESTRIENSPWQSWTTPEYAFQPFKNATAIANGNLTVPTMGYSAYLNCTPYNLVEYLIENGLSDGLKPIPFNITDGGCEVSSTYSPINGSLRDIKEFVKSSCPGLVGLTRLVVESVTYNSTKSTQIQDFNIISCTSSYWQTPLNLTVSLSPRGSLDFVDLEANRSAATALDLSAFGGGFEGLLAEGVIIDPSINDTINTNDLGLLIYKPSSQSSPNNPMDPDSLSSALEQAFTSLYAKVVSDSMMQPMQLNAINGTFNFFENRVVVRSPVAWVLVTIMVFVLVCSVWLFWHARYHRTILTETPVGLLGYAAILQGSDVFPRLQERLREGQRVQPITHLHETYNLQNFTCFYDDKALPGRIMLGDVC
jgi:hypothetical protein